MFLRFKTISELEPRFYENYSYGGPYLSIIKDDLTGASYLYDRGLSFYPNSAHLLLNAGFHYEFEVKDSDKAYPLIKRLSKIEKSTMLTTTLAKLEARNGDLSDALIIMNELQSSFSKNTIFWEKIYNYRYAIKAEIDLKCLNEKNIKCQTHDLDGNKYIVTNGIFKAQKILHNPNINNSATNEKNAEILGNLFKALDKLETGNCFKLSALL